MPVMSEEIFRALQRLAAKAAISPDWDDWYRRICRWYSREFNTPLGDVYKLAEEEVVKTYFEDIYYSLSQKTDDESRTHWETLIEDVSMSDAERKAAESAAQENEDSDDEWYKEELSRLQNIDNKKNESLQDDSPEGVEKSASESNPNLIPELPDHIVSKGEQHLAAYGIGDYDPSEYDSSDDDSGENQE